VYIVLAIIASAVIVAGHAAGDQIERTERQENLAFVAAGRDASADANAQSTSTTLGAPPASAVPPATLAPDEAPAAVPAWVQAIRGTQTWASPSGREVASTVAQWQYLRVLGAVDTRFQVSAADDPRTEAWIDVADVALSGAPPDWVRANRRTSLYANAEGTDQLNEADAGVDMMIAGEPQAQRLFVYLPGEPTARRTGYGWVDADAVGASVAPRDVALPSPSFHAVPRGRPGSYRVRSGDTVSSIAVAQGMTADALRRVNGFDAAAPIYIGQVLQVPLARPASLELGVGPQKIREVSPGFVSAERAVVIDGDSGQILWSREANTPIAPASLTKIVTALVVLDHADLTDRVTVRVDSRRMTDSTVMGISPGEELTIEDLLYGMMLPSGNDAALALAEYIAGTREVFGEMMTEKARSLGLTSSSFVNPHGLDAPNHYSSAFDMAMLAREGMKNPIFQQLAAAKHYETSHGKGYELGNLNQLLWRYPGADGVKIGFTNAAGRAIVGSAVKDGHRVYVAMMRSNDTYTDSAHLLDWAFASYTWP